MEKVTFSEVRQKFMEYNEDHNVRYGTPTNTPPLSAVVVYKQSNFTKPYTEKERSYRVSSLGVKAFFIGMLVCCIFGDCLDVLEFCVRLDAYRWDLDYCYFD